MTVDVVIFRPLDVSVDVADEAECPRGSRDRNSLELRTPSDSRTSIRIRLAASRSLFRPGADGSPYSCRDDCVCIVRIPREEPSDK